MKGGWNNRNLLSCIERTQRQSQARPDFVQSWTDAHFLVEVMCPQGHKIFVARQKFPSVGEWLSSHPFLSSGGLSTKLPAALPLGLIG